MPSTTHDTLLRECRDLFRDHLLETVRQTLDQVAASLAELADKTTSFEVRNRYLDARVLAVRHRDVIEAQFARRFMAEFQNRIDRTTGRQALAELSMEDLQLVEHDDLNETLSFNDMATQMRRHCEDEMSALDQRAAVLLGKSSIDADDNPFGPKVVSDAFKHACQQVDCPLEVRLLFMRSFEKFAMDGIRGSCREVNDLLVANAVLPKIRYGYTRNESNPASSQGADAAAAASAPAAPTPEQAEAKKQDMFSMLSELLGGGAAGGASGGGSGGGAGNDLGKMLGGSGGAFRDLTGGSGLGVGGVPLVAGAQLMGSLTQLQRGDVSTMDAAVAAELAPILAQAGNMQNVLRQLKETSVGAGMGHMDAMTLEIVSMLFDALFDDAKVPLAVKGLIGRLQLPMLKVAIADKELFSSKTHPARRLLDTIGQLGMRLPRDLGADSPVFVKIAGFIDELIRVFQENMDVFDATRLQFEAMIAAADAQIALRMQETQKTLEQAERLSLAKAEVQDDLRARVAAHPDMPHTVFEYLAQHWIKYLVVVRARDGADSDGWRAAAKATDQLLWSLQPKTTPEDRSALTKAIPELLRALRAGATAGGIESDVATAFYTQLLDCHKGAMRTVAQPAPAAAMAPDSKSAISVVPPELDFTQNVTVDNPFGEGKVEVTDDDLDFTGHAAAPAMQIAADTPKRPPRPAQKVRLPSAMIVGAWVTVEEAQTRHARPARLHYVSPMKSHFLFVDRQGNKVFECSRTMLARRLQMGEVVMLDGEPDNSLFDRIMEGIFGKLRKQPELQAA